MKRADPPEPRVRDEIPSVGLPTTMQIDEGPRVARYRLTERLGEGGLGVVFAAHDPRLDREVAVKLIRLGARDGRAFDRLRREATALARVSHPHVVGVFDVGRYDARARPGWPSDVPKVGVYIVMELVGGVDLRRWFESPRDPSEITRVFLAAGRGLAAAHAAGVVHRDFKPANVIMDESGMVKVLDFGLAQWLHPSEPSTTDEGDGSHDPGSATSMTMTGTVMGTPAYMAPEQHEGQKVDARCDQYAFCVALAEALCGERPFQGDTAAEIHRAKTELRLHPRARDISSRLRAVLERGLARDPDDRWPTMNALLDALEPRSRARWWGLAALVGGVGAAGWLLASSASAPPASAVVPEQPSVPASVGGNLPSLEAEALRRSAEAAWSRGEAELRRVLDAVDLKELADNASLEAEVLLWQGHLGTEKEGAELFKRAYFLAREVDVPSTAARAATAMATAVVGDHGQGLAEWTRHGWAELERGPWDRGAAVDVAVTAAYGRSIALQDEQAEAMLDFATAVVGDVEPTDGPQQAHRMLQLAHGWRFLDEPESALWWARRSMVLLDGVAEANHPLRALAAGEVGMSLTDLDRCDEAVTLLDESMQRYLSHEDDVWQDDAALTRDRVAWCLWDLGRLDEAIAEYRLVLEYWAGRGEEYTVPRLDAHLTVARIMVEQGRTDDAEQEYEQALAIVDPTAPDHPLRKEAREELAALREARD